MSARTFVLFSILGIMATGCTTGESVGPNSTARRQLLDDRAQLAFKEMTRTDPALNKILHNAYAYAVLPEVGQGAVGIGGAGGNGVVYRNGQHIGTVTLNQLSVGPQVGGESYSELVIWQDEPAFNRFKNGNLEWGAQSTAQLIKTGAASVDRFDQGVSVYVLPRSGLEVGVSLNGQKLMFHPGNSSDNADNSNNGNNDTGSGTRS